MHDVSPIVEHLKKAHTELLRACQEVPAEGWRKSPSEGAWSAGEVIAHLMMVEERVANGVQKQLRGEPQAVPFWKRVHLPVSLASLRGIKAKTPIPLDRSLVGEKDEMLEKFSKARELSVALLVANGRRPLGAYRMPHPFFGSLNCYDWFRMLAYHEDRHRQQIREIVRSFQR